MFKIILIILIIALVLYLMFPIGFIFGDSMYPTYKDGERVLVSRLHKKLEVGKVYAFKRVNEYGQEVCVIKRLDDIYTNQCGQTLLYFRGDNPSVSFDSRHYGYIHEEDVIGQIIPQRRRKLNNERP